MSGLITKVVAGVSASDWIPCNHLQAPFAIGFAVLINGSGAPTYSVQHTFQDVFANATVTAGAIFDHPDVSGKTTKQDGNYAFPIGALRLNVTSAGSAASAVLQVRQAGV